MPPKSKGTDVRGLTPVIKAVTDPLGLTVLIVLLADGTFGGLAAKGGPNQQVAFYGLFFFLAVTFAFVAYLVIFKHQPLSGGASGDEGSAKVRDFSEKLSGDWWETITSGRGPLSSVEVSRDASTQTVKLNGRMYDSDGELAATWETESSCIDLNKRKVFYYWSGTNFKKPNNKYEGLGEITFYESLNDAQGHFSDTNLADLTSAAMKSFLFKRMSKDEAECLRSGDHKSIAALVKGKLNVAT